MCGVSAVQETISIGGENNVDEMILNKTNDNRQNKKSREIYFHSFCMLYPY